LNDLKVYFSDFFDVDGDIIEDYGAVNISLINDLPLFIDPFLLFNSEKEQYQTIHREIIDYLLFLKSQAEAHPTVPSGMLSAWYLFPEIKQTWLGFSLSGNSGRGLGNDFARNLHNGLLAQFKEFGKETIPVSPHMEKLCLISSFVGRDKISDFTTNFAKKYLLEYTQTFATKYLRPELCASFDVKKTDFNYQTETWQTRRYTLPCFDDDYVLLTPKDILTGDDTFINRKDMLNSLELIAPAVSDVTLRFELNNYLRNVLNKKRSKKQKKISKGEREHAAIRLIQTYPELIDYYLKYKEENGQKATSISKEAVRDASLLFNIQLQELVTTLKNNTDFYREEPNSYEATYKRVMYLKHVIEDQDGYRAFYIDKKPVKREHDLHIMFRLCWYASSFDVNQEPNNGRGPVDFKISKGAKDITLAEFKLASNSKFKHNLANQVEIYKRANETDKAIKVILYFTDAELDKVNSVLNELNLHRSKDIVLIDARNDKISASNVKI
jgi:hypothetical protein